MEAIFLKMIKLLLITIIFYCVGHANSYGKKQVVDHRKSLLITTGEWAPYTGAKIPGKGIAIEFFELIHKESPFKFEFIFLPWKRALRKAGEDKEILGSFPWSLTEEREKNFYSTKGFLNNRELFFKYKDRIKGGAITSISNLKDYRVGGMRSYAHVGVMEKQGVNVLVVNTELMNLKKLISGRIDTFPSTPEVIWKLIAKELPHELKNFKVLTGFKIDSKLAFLINKKYPDYKTHIKTFNAGLERILKTGEYDQVIKKYGLEHMSIRKID
jgi:polar amino acid transport system substrate-binding protein